MAKEKLSINHPKLRRGYGALEMWSFNFARFSGYSSQSHLMAAFPNILERETNDLILRCMRDNHVLRFCQGEGADSLYFETTAPEKGTMEHAIPASHWLQLYHAAGEASLKEAVLFAGWCCPIARVTKTTDSAVSANGERKVNRTPRLPFMRYHRAAKFLDGYVPLIVEHGPDGTPVMDWTLERHYHRVRAIPYMEEVFAAVCKRFDFDAAVKWIETYQPDVNYEPDTSSDERGRDVEITACAA